MSYATTKEFTEQQAKNLAEHLTKSGLAGVRVEGDVVAFPLIGGHVFLEVTAMNGYASFETKLAALKESQVQK